MEKKETNKLIYRSHFETSIIEVYLNLKRVEVVELGYGNKRKKMSYKRDSKYVPEWVSTLIDNHQLSRWNNLDDK